MADEDDQGFAELEDPENPYRVLPDHIPIEDMIPTKDPSPPPDPEMGRNPERDFMLRNAAG